MRRPLFLLLALLLAAAGAIPSLGGADARQRQRPDKPQIVSHPDAVRSLPRGARDSVDGWYVVTLDPSAGDPGAVADEIAARDGAVVGYVYRHAVRGFAARLDAAALKALRRDGRVRAVVADIAVAPPPRPVPGALPRQDFPPVGQTTPDGVKRIQAPENPLFQSGSVDIDVAVIDTGIDGSHPDLGVAGGYSCVGTDPLVDGFGHGTHVAGTIGALDNGIGVIGVAPGARLWSVQVLDATGSGSMASVICGIDWVTANAATVDVANMSLTGYAKKPLEDGNCGLTVGDPEHTAICASVAAGVTYVVAAGNDCRDTSRFSPAAYDEVITVGAMVDTDGQPGAYGMTSFAGQCDRYTRKGKPVGESGQVINPDDAMASFSNVGASIDLWAPGVEILSTYPADLAWSNRPYVTLSGTSMASPHVAGAAALVMAEHPGYSPAQVQQALLEGAEIMSIWNPYTGYKWNNGRESVPGAAIANVNPAGPWPASE